MGSAVPCSEAQLHSAERVYRGLAVPCSEARLHSAERVYMEVTPRACAKQDSAAQCAPRACTEQDSAVQCTPPRSRRKQSKNHAHVLVNLGSVHGPSWQGVSSARHTSSTCCAARRAPICRPTSWRMSQDSRSVPSQPTGARWLPLEYHIHST